MKHAYLIIAHNEFVILQKLIDSLDDERNDIYVFFDKKVSVLPNLNVRKSKLKILENRLNIYWGHFSLVRVGMLLFKAVAYQNYSYCHLISGVHLPLYSQDFLHCYFQEKYPKQVFSPIAFNPKEVDMRLNMRSYFIRYYKSPNRFVQRLAEIGWVGGLKIQKILNIRRYKYKEYLKFSNWVSVTQEAVDYLVDNENEILNNFKFAFCADEFYVPTALRNSTIPFELFADERLLYQNFKNTHAVVINKDDFENLMKGESLFARKFSENAIEVVEMVMNNYKNR